MLLTVIAAGCAVQPAAPALSPEREVLVILEDAGEPPLPAGSKRGYRGDLQWPVSLHARARADAVGRDHGLRKVFAWPIPELKLFCVVFEIPAGRTRADLLHSLDADPRIARAQNVNVFQGMLSHGYDDPLVDLQYGRHRQELESVHALTTGRGVHVGIVDSHVDADHVDLRGQIAAQFPPRRRSDSEDLRHGTAVAGVIAAAAGNGEGLVGLAPGATVSIYAGCRESADGVTRCTTVSLAEAIGQAVEDAADIINLSLGGPYDWLLEHLLQYAHERGAVLVAAYSADPLRSFPGSLPFVHAAGPGARPWFARDEQFSTLAGGGYQVFFGSSMSAAGVTGVAALLRTRWSAPETEVVLDTLLHAGCSASSQDDWPLRIMVAHEHCGD